MWVDIAIGVVLMLAAVAIVHVAIVLLGRNRHIIRAGCAVPIYAVPALLAGTCVYQCSVRNYDVTARYPQQTGTTWCMSDEAFIFQFSDEPTLYIEAVGPDSGLPNNIAQYEADHSWWHPNALRAPTEAMPPPTHDVFAAVPKGGAFRIVRVVEEHHPENGISLRPQILIVGELARFGLLDATFLMDPLDHQSLNFKHAAPCTVPPNSPLHPTRRRSLARH